MLEIGLFLGLNMSYQMISPTVASMPLRMLLAIASRARATQLDRHLGRAEVYHRSNMQEYNRQAIIVSNVKAPLFDKAYPYTIAGASPELILDPGCPSCIL